jgi:uncharacterized YigZ family protein
MQKNSDIYNTIKHSAEGIFKEKGSKFISFIHPVNNEEEAKSLVNNYKKKYYNARHHCFAYIIGENKEYYRANDDNEPPNSAGQPILGQINAFNLTNTLIIVVRYFGGTLLGIGGLINAYKNAAKNAIENAEIIEKQIQALFKLKFPYEILSNVLKILNDNKIDIIKQNFNVDCEIIAGVRLNAEKKFNSFFGYSENLIIEKIDKEMLKF